MATPRWRWTPTGRCEASSTWCGGSRRRDGRTCSPRWRWPARWPGRTAARWYGAREGSWWWEGRASRPTGPVTRSSAGTRPRAGVTAGARWSGPSPPGASSRTSTTPRRACRPTRATMSSAGRWCSPRPSGARGAGRRRRWETACRTPRSSGRRWRIGSTGRASSGLRSVATCSPPSPWPSPGASSRSGSVDCSARRWARCSTCSRRWRW
jgi:hypothetical protein